MSVYEAFLEQARRAFSASPDPEFWVGVPAHRQALDLILDFARQAKSFALVTGAPGIGKTMVVQAAQRYLAGASEVGVIAGTLGADDSLAQRILAAFGRRPAGEAPAAARELQQFLFTPGEGIRRLLLIDEAEALSEPVLRELCALTELRPAGQLRLQVVLVGRPALRTLLETPGMTALSRRLALRCDLAPLDFDATCAYIRGRLQIAGIAAELFTPRALAAIHFLADGLPRQINVLCALALLHGALEHSRTIDIDAIRSVAAERRDVVAVLPVELDAEPVSVAAEAEPEPVASSDAPEEQGAPALASLGIAPAATEPVTAEPATTEPATTGPATTEPIGMAEPPRETARSAIDVPPIDNPSIDMPAARGQAGRDTAIEYRSVVYPSIAHPSVEFEPVYSGADDYAWSIEPIAPAATAAEAATTAIRQQDGTAARGGMRLRALPRQLSAQGQSGEAPPLKRRFLPRD
jgi:general secretion pathway protein A